jgi:hypothetical protein
MRAKVQEVQKAKELRKKGYTYRDILEEVKVAKSTLSLHLKDMPLTENERKYLKSRRNSNISRGRIKAAASNHQRRVERDRVLFEQSKREFLEKSKNPFFHVGIALYWAEGAKRNEIFSFSNSDPDMISIMILWIEKFFYVPRANVRARLFTHKPFAHENNEKFWSETCSIPFQNFRKTIYKPTGKLIKKRPNYKGCLRIELGKVIFLKKLKFWQNMLIEYYKKRGNVVDTRP